MTTNRSAKATLFFAAVVALQTDHYDSANFTISLVSVVFIAYGSELAR